MHRAHPIGGRLVTPFTTLLALLALIALWVLAQRFVHGLGAVTHLNNGYPWGIWVVFDVVVVTGLACGGYVVAFSVYVANRFQYHPLVRPAMLASLLGYGLGGLGAVVDMGRYLNVYNLVLPGQMNFTSVMLEVALCVAIYILVLTVEASPAFLERFRLHRHQRKLERVMFVFIALGLVLPTMHQSSLGTLLVVLGNQIAPLWQSYELMPLLALLSAAIMGFSILLFEGFFSQLGFRRASEAPLLAAFARPVAWLLVAWLVVRFAELMLRGKLGHAFAPSGLAAAFWLETLLFALPLWVLLSPQRRRRAHLLLIAAVAMILAGAVYRVNAFLIAHVPPAGYHYFPSATELSLTIGLVALKILVFIIVVKRFPIISAPARS